MKAEELEKLRQEFEMAARELEQTGTAFMAGSIKWEQVSARYQAARDSYDFALRSAQVVANTEKRPVAKKVKLDRFTTAFGEYSIGPVLGEGGTGKVFEAADEDGRTVAVKCLRPGSVTTNRSKRFRNEIGFCIRNVHPNIVTAIDWGLAEVEGEQVPFYVMRLYPTTLRKVMQAGGIEHERIIRLFTQMLSGIEAAHQQGVWHRDLKPENLLYDPDADQVVIADFGIAHFAEPLLRTLIETGSQERLANFQYAAPEQRTKKEADSRADAYALGLILNEMFTGELLQGTGHKLIGSVAPQVAYLDAIVHRMVRQSPTERPSVAEVRQMLGTSAPSQKVEPHANDAAKIGGPVLNVPKADPMAIKIAKLRTVGPNIFIQPIIPLRCALDKFMLVDETGPDIVEFEKMGSGHRISIPRSRIREVLPEDRDWRRATVILEGRLQWISMLQTWRFFPETPPNADVQIGLGKPSPAMDQKRIDIESILGSRGSRAWLIDDRYLSTALAEGRQVVYDDDGRYFRVPSGPNHLVLISSGL